MIQRESKTTSMKATSRILEHFLIACFEPQVPYEEKLMTIDLEIFKRSFGN